jgi:hypothetical protein
MPFLLTVLIACILAGLAVWVLQTVVSDAKIVAIGRVIIIVALVLWLLSSFFGFPAGLGNWSPRYR